MKKLITKTRLVFALPLVAAAVAVPSMHQFQGSAQAASSATVITGGTFNNAPTVYGVQVTGLRGTDTRLKGYQPPADSRGDTWFNTWANDGNIYATSNDTWGFNGDCRGQVGGQSNDFLAVNELVGDDPTHLTSPFVNCMTSFGGSGTPTPDGCTWKTGGITSVDGTLYLAVARQIGGQCSAPSDAADGEQPSMNASIIKSTDNGRTWSNAFGVTGDPGGAAPAWDASLGRYQAMFPGRKFSAPFFIQYGQDDDPATTADGGDKYVYAVSNDGYAYDGSTMTLARVPRSKIGDLRAADWQFYTGSPGGNGTDDANWSSNVDDAHPVLTASHGISQPAIQYIPALHRYLLVTFRYPFIPSTKFPTSPVAAQSTFTFYESPHPWGPWTASFSKDTSMRYCYIDCAGPNATMPLGLYDPTLVNKFIRMDGLSNVLFTSGDFRIQSRGTGDPKLYALHALPLALSTNKSSIADDSARKITYNGDWNANTYQTTTLDYFEGTMHASNTPGASMSYRFAGNTIKWIGSTDNNHGIAEVSIDNGPPVAVDTYSSSPQRQQTLFTRTDLSPGQHTVTITVTGQNNPASRGVYQDVDALVTANGS